MTSHFSGNLGRLGFQCVPLSPYCDDENDDFLYPVCQLEATSLNLPALKVDKQSMGGFRRETQLLLRV